MSEVEELKAEIADLKTRIKVTKTRVDYVQKILIGGLLVTGMNFIGILIMVLNVIRNG